MKQNNNINWQDIAMFALAALLLVLILVGIKDNQDPRTCELTGIAFGAEHCLDDTIYARPDPPLADVYSQPKLIRTFRVGDDVEPHIHLIYEVVIDGEVLRYAEVITR